MKKRYIFIAVAKWRPRLTKFEVIKETPKMLKLGEATSILGGRIWGSQIHKENNLYFDDPTEAIEYLIAEQAKTIRHHEIELDNAHDDRELLEEVLKELEKGDSDVVDIVSKALSP